MSQSVGEQLKQARAARGLTLDQAAQATRIRRHYLEALERGDREVLPSPVQGRGFLRLYSGYLGVNGEALVAEWEGRPAQPNQPPPEPPAPKEPQRAARAISTAPPTPPPLAEAEPGLPPPEGSSAAIFAEIGQTLRHQREQLGLTIEEIEKHTRVRLHYLTALEAGRFDELPSAVQSRGMLSNYAAFLNMDADQVMLRFAEALQAARLERLPAPSGASLLSNRRTPARNGTAPQARRLITPDLLLIGGLILALFVFIVWTAARVSTSRTNPVNATLPSVSDVLLYTSSPSPAPSSSAPAPTSSTPAAPGAEPELNATGTLIASPAALITSTLGAINSDPVQVYIIARRRVFLRVTIDGQIKFNGRLVPGNAYPFSAKTNLDILSGDAAGLQIFYNQKDLGTLGASGEPIELNFTSTGMQTPTATTTPTATLTPLFSPTPTPALTNASPTPTPSVTPLVP